MQWSKLMEKIYQFWGSIAQMALDGLDYLIVVGEQVLQLILNVLAQLGVPEAQRLMVAYICCYTIVTLLILFLVWRMVRRRMRPREKIEAEPPSAEPLADSTPVAKPTPEKPDVEVDVPALSLFDRMKAGLAKTQNALLGRVDALFSGASAVDEDFLEELEEILITADFGMKTTQLLLDAFKARVAEEKTEGAAQLRIVFKEEILRLMTLNVAPLDVDREGPFVLLVIGVNGVGKTTTIGKLAQQYTQQGKKVILGAADTFRAAAADQLSVWGERTGVTVIRHEEGSDPAAVAFDSVKAAVARGADMLILDTAGRLHTKVNLMEEMKKIHRVMGREIPQAPHETLLVLDATTGQNALVQARLFQEAVGITGIAITKLDGTAKGGMAVAIGAELGLPVRFIGIGEGIDDLRPFDAEMFVDALFENH